MTKKLTLKEFHKLAGSYYFETSWSNGGTWVNYTGDCGTHSADEPALLTGHIEFLATMFPEVNMRTFVSIQEKIITGTRTHCDYYGGETSETTMHINIADIADILVEDGYLEFVEEGEE